MQIIKIKDGEYLVKEGTMSNYSFELKDEKNDHLLDTIIEDSGLFPQDESSLVDKLSNINAVWSKERISETIKKLTDFNFLNYKNADTQKVKVVVITNQIDLAKKKFGKIESVQILEYLDDDASKTEDKAFVEHINANAELILVFSTWYNPTLFYKINQYCIQNQKSLVISYLDGNEGVLVPLINFSQTGCYNDFELLREASFHNLLDYQVAKEQIIRTDTAPGKKYFDELYEDALLIRTSLLIRKIISDSFINYYAYEFDFERLVDSKIRLIKFPKCPSCQGDKNLTHPFI